MEYKICPNCKTANKINARNCMNCGHYIKDAPGSAPQSKNGLILGIIANSLIIISMFLPFISVSLFGYTQSISLSGNGNDWLFFVALALACLLFTISKKWILHLLFSIVVIIFVFIEFNSVTELQVSDMVSMGVGFYVLVMAALCNLISPILIKIENY